MRAAIHALIHRSGPLASALNERPASPPQTPRASDSLPVGQSFERHFTTTEIAKIWNCHRATITKIFTDYPGVLHLGGAGRGSELRIPESILLRVYKERSSGFLKVQRRRRAI